MKKIKLSVGVLAFMGLAALNFTQSESCLVSKSLAANTCCNDTITTSDDSSSTSSSSTSSTSSTDTSSSSSGNSSSSDVSGLGWGCSETTCSEKRTKKVKVEGKVGNDTIGAGGSYETTVEYTFNGHIESCFRVADGKKSCRKAHCNKKCH